MPHKLRNTRKKRGSRTQGYGRIGQHRDAGSRPYRKVGFHKHRWSYMLKKFPNYFGKHGFTSPQSLKLKENVINLTKLCDIAAASSETEIDLTSMGYTKLLGTGNIKQPLTITVPQSSAKAKEKVEAAGGKVITTDEDEFEEDAEFEEVAK
ncbi:MAG: 50S ribosomal protein L15 [Candidatus Bathyarchaeota archaeon]|nr:50S ribosomal protein L15 [Candidatus Bathyarchaeota archaeon]